MKARQCKNLWDSVKAVLRGRFIAIQACLKKQEKSQVNLTLHLKQLEKEELTIVNTYAPNIGALQYVRQMLISMKGEINSNTIIVGDFNTPLTSVDRSTKQKINRETKT